MKQIQKIESKKPLFPTKKRVAAYARVSKDTDRLNHSLSAQASYYNQLIQNNPDWEFVGVYADLGISGTKKENREEFQRLIQDCEHGKIDIVLTKSIQRFSRNTVDLLETVRHLKDLGVEVWFEKENIHTLTGDGELMLTILASFAQDEIQSLSDNIKWQIRKKYEQGKPHIQKNSLGYRWKDDEMVIVPEEAEAVKFIFESYLNHLSANETAIALNNQGFRSITGEKFTAATIASILTNKVYTGILELQKEYKTDPFTKKKKRNHGELPKYIVEDHHEPIISKKLWDDVHQERMRRLQVGKTWNWKESTSCFTSNIRCQYCGKNYKRKHSKQVDNSYAYWHCHGKSKSKEDCHSYALREDMLKKLTVEVLGIDEFNEEVYREQIDHLEILNWEITFIFKNGRKEKRVFARTEKELKDILIRGEQARVKIGTPFSGFVSCGRCDGRCKTRKVYLLSGEIYRTYNCPTTPLECPPNVIRDSVLRSVVCEVLKLESFNEDIMKQQLDHIYIEDGIVRFLFTNGHEERRTYEKRY